MLSGVVVRRAQAADEAAVVALLRAESLEATFVAHEFVVAAHEGAPVACARLKPLADGSHELASVAVRADLRGRGLGERVVRAALEGTRGPVHALALAPGFFERVGFVRTPEAAPALREKMAGMCASSGAAPMTRAGAPTRRS